MVFEDLEIEYEEYSNNQKANFLETLRNIREKSPTTIACQCRAMKMHAKTSNKIVDGEDVTFETFARYLAYYGFEIEFVDGEDSVSYADAMIKVNHIASKYLEVRSTPGHLEIKKRIDLDTIRNEFSNEVEKRLFSNKYKTARKKLFSEVKVHHKYKDFLSEMSATGISIKAKNYNIGKQYDLVSYSESSLNKLNNNKSAFITMLKNKYIMDYGYTQEDLSKQLGLSVSEVNEIINARGGSIYNNVKLLEKLGYKVEIKDEKGQVRSDCIEDMEQLNKRSIFKSGNNIYDFVDKLKCIGCRLEISGEDFYKSKKITFGNFEIEEPEDKVYTYDQIREDINIMVKRNRGLKEKIHVNGGMHRRVVRAYLKGERVSLSHYSKILEEVDKNIYLQNDEECMSINVMMKYLNKIDSEYVHRDQGRRVTIDEAGREAIKNIGSDIINNSVPSRYGNIDFGVDEDKVLPVSDARSFMNKLEDDGYEVVDMGRMFNVEDFNNERELSS